MDYVGKKICSVDFVPFCRTLHFDVVHALRRLEKNEILRREYAHAAIICIFQLENFYLKFTLTQHQKARITLGNYNHEIIWNRTKKFKAITKVHLFRHSIATENLHWDRTHSTFSSRIPTFFPPARVNDTGDILVSGHFWVARTVRMCSDSCVLFRGLYMWPGTTEGCSVIKQCFRNVTFKTWKVSETWCFRHMTSKTWK